MNKVYANLNYDQLRELRDRLRGTLDGNNIDDKPIEDTIKNMS